jgi:hypothetical protein
MKRPAATDVSASQALAAAREAVSILSLKKQQVGGNPLTDAQIDALLAAADLFARDAREDWP